MISLNNIDLLFYDLSICNELTGELFKVAKEAA